MTLRITPWKITAGLLLWGALAVTSPAVWAEDMPSTPTAAANPSDTSAAAELARWNSIKDSANPEDFLNYLNAFPNGMFFDPAKQRYEELSGKKFEPGSDTAGSETGEPGGAVSPPPKPPATPAKVKKTVEPVKVRKTVKSRAKTATTQARKASEPRKAKLVSITPKKPVKLASTATVKKKTAKRTRVAKLPVVKTKKAVQVFSSPKRCPAGMSASGECITAAVVPRNVIPIRENGGRGGGGGGGGRGGGGGGWGG